MKKKILVIVAHPDDEALGCGATIAKHTQEGDRVFCLSFTDGISGRKNDSNKVKFLKRTRELESKKAEKLLGFKWINYIKKDFPDNSLDSTPIIKIVRIIEEAKEKIKPHLIYTHFIGDLNIDHRVVAEATLVAFRPQDKENWEEIRFFEVPSATDYGYALSEKRFEPNLYINVKKTFKKKISALKAYKSEMKKFPHSRSLKGLQILANYRGMESGIEFAEAFEVKRKIIR